MMRMVFPLFKAACSGICIFSNIASQAVRATNGIEAATSQLAVFGFNATILSSMS